MFFRFTLLCLALCPVTAMADGFKPQPQAPEPTRHQVSLEYGLLDNADPNNQNTQYGGIGMRYAYVFDYNVALLADSFHDEVAVEAGLFYYNISGFQSPADQITVLPVIATLRYGVTLGKYLTPFGYAGVMKNFSNRDILNRFRLALGGGATINVVRNFAIRLDLGTDIFGFGLVGRF